MIENNTCIKCIHKDVCYLYRLNYVCSRVVYDKRAEYIALQERLKTINTKINDVVNFKQEDDDDKAD